MAAFRSGLSYRQVAEQLDLTVGTVQSHIKQARKLGELGEEALRSKGRPKLINDAVDASMVKIMKEKDTKNAKVIHEELGKPPYRIKLSYEVVRRRVKQLVESVSSIGDGSNQESGGNAVGEGSQGAADADTSGDEQVARDLDMLAETVRTIVSNDKPTDAESEEENVHDTGFENNDDDEDHADAMIPSEHGLTKSTEGPLTAELHSNDRGSQILIGPPEVITDEPSHETLVNTLEVANRVTSAPLPTQTSSPPATAVPSDRASQSQARSSEVAADEQPSRVAEVSSSLPTQTSIPPATTAPSNTSLASAKPPVPVSTRKPKNAEYKPEVRAECVRKHEVDGMSYASIAREMNIPQDSVRAIVRKAKRTGTVQTAPRSGRPRKTSEIVDRVILQAVRANEKSSAKAIQENLLKVFNVKISSETIRRRVLANTRQRLLAVSSGQETEESTPENALPISDGAATRVDDRARANASQTVREWTAEVNQRMQEFSAGLAHSTAPESMLQSAATESESVMWANGTKRPSQAIDSMPDMLVHEGRNVSLSSTSTPNEETLSSQPKKKRAKRREYSVELREQCVAMHQRGDGYRRIGQALDMPHTTVRAIVEKVTRTGSVLPAPRSGRPRKTDSIVDRVILEAVRNNEKCSARMIQEELLHSYGVRISCETIRRRVKDHSRQNLVQGSTEQSEYVQDVHPTQSSEDTIAVDVASVGPDHSTPGDPLQPQPISAEQMLQLMPLPGVSDATTTVVL